MTRILFQTPTPGSGFSTITASARRPLRRADLAALIDDLGFVQVIAFAPSNRPTTSCFRALVVIAMPGSAIAERTPEVFENWTHDAAIIPTRYFGYWRPNFGRPTTA